MPIDLDEMFTTLGRQADAIPLATAERARQRGRQRNRTRVVLSAGVAVCLIFAGVAVSHHRHANRPVNPAASNHALLEVGSPILLGGTPVTTTTAETGGRMFVASQNADGTIRLTAADMRTGTLVWQAGIPDAGPGATIHLENYAQGVLVTVAPGNARDAGGAMYVYNGTTGKQQWTAPFDSGDDLVPHHDVLVRMSAKTGRTEAFDWDTGRTRWALPPGADRPMRTIGNYWPDQYTAVASSRLNRGFLDNHLVQVTKAGKAQVRDVRTGALQRTSTADVPDTSMTFIAYDGWLFYNDVSCCDSYTLGVRTTNLLHGNGESTLLMSAGPGRAFTGMTPCGPGRLCVLDRSREDRDTITAIDVSTRRQLWQVAGPGDATSIESANGRILAFGGAEPTIYDENGRQAVRVPGATIDWWDEDSMLVLPTGVAGSVIEVTISDARIIRLGDLPATSGQCHTSGSRLACPTGSTLRIWRLPS